MRKLTDYELCYNLYSCFETCYWHLIEKRFCFDESIATYEEPVAKEEKNNNLFDNMAFYDSVSVIAGRAVVTIDPLPAKKDKDPIMEQPKRLTWQDKKIFFNSSYESLGTAPALNVEKPSDESGSCSSDLHNSHADREEEDLNLTPLTKKTVSFQNMLNRSLNSSAESATIISKSDNSLYEPKMEVELRKKSLRERRMSKSLYLKIDYPKEVPIIRQSSVPKFYLDTPERNQTQESILIKHPLTALKSPVCSNGFCYDLKSVVQIETMRRQESSKDLVAVHKESTRLGQIKDRMKLKKSKSTVSASNIPHSNYI